MTDDILIPFPDLFAASFLKRNNRFSLECLTDRGEIITAYLPNPGRLLELLVPDAQLLLIPTPGKNRRLTSTCVGVRRDGMSIMLQTHTTNDVAQFLLEHQAIPSLAGSTIIGREVTRGHSRFDFLLSNNGRTIWCEVKSCTLFSGNVAMFPDAVTDRGRRHVEELAALSTEDHDTDAAILFIVQWPRAHYFLPDFHTDIAFARSLIAHHRRIRIIAAGIAWSDDLRLTPHVRELTIPWDLATRESVDQGLLLSVFKLSETTTLPPSDSGSAITLSTGFHVLIEEFRSSLDAGLKQNKKQKKTISFSEPGSPLLARNSCLYSFPVRTADRILDLAVQEICSLVDQTPVIWRTTHNNTARNVAIIPFPDNPIVRQDFIAKLLSLRMDRLISAESPSSP